MRRVLLPKEGWFDKTCLNSIEKASVEFMGSRLMFTVSILFLFFSSLFLVLSFISFYSLFYSRSRHTPSSLCRFSSPGRTNQETAVV